MSRFEAMARDHWHRWLPDAYASLQDPDRFFRDLADEAQRQLDDLSLDLRGEDPLQEGFEARMARFTRARQTAEEIVCREVLLPAPEPPRVTDPGRGHDEYEDAVDRFYRLRDVLTAGEPDPDLQSLPTGEAHP